MADMMDYPPTWEEFIDNFTILDIKEVYTNRDVLVQLFRVKQMMEHYFKPERITPADRMLCQHCGYSIVYQDGDDVYTWDYCPHCGARIVD